MGTYYQDQKKIYIWMRNIVKSLPEEGININMLKLQCMEQFATSNKLIDNIINMYLEAGLINKLKNNIYPVHEDDNQDDQKSTKKPENI